MYRLLSVFLVSLLLTGCFSNPMKQEPIDTSFYLIDLEKNVMCQGESNVCQNLSDLYVDPVKTQEVERLYKQKALHTKNDRTAILKMIIRPDNKIYVGEKYSANGRYYKIPASSETKQLFEILKGMEHQKQLIR